MKTKALFILSICVLLISCGDDRQIQLTRNREEFKSIEIQVNKCIDEIQYSEGEKLYDSFLNLDSSNYEYQRLGGDIKLLNGKIEEAVNHYTKALTIRPTEEVYQILAQVFLKENSPENHIKCIKELINLNPKNSAYYCYYAEHFAKQGIYIVAIESISKAIALGHDPAELYLMRADYKILFGDTLGAINDCDSSLAYDKENCKAYINKSTYCVWYSDSKRTIETANEGIKKDCDKGLMLYRRGLAKLMVNDFLGAREDIIAAIKFGNQEAKAFPKNFKDVRIQALFPLIYRESDR